MSIIASDSDTLTRKPSSSGTKTSWTSDTTSIWGWASEPYNNNNTYLHTCKNENRTSLLSLGNCVSSCVFHGCLISIIRIIYVNIQIAFCTFVTRYSHNHINHTSFVKSDLSCLSRNNLSKSWRMRQTDRLTDNISSSQPINSTAKKQCSNIMWSKNMRHTAICNKRFFHTTPNKTVTQLNQHQIHCNVSRYSRQKAQKNKQTLRL